MKYNWNPGKRDPRHRGRAFIDSDIDNRISDRLGGLASVAAEGR